MISAHKTQQGIIFSGWTDAVFMATFLLIVWVSVGAMMDGSTAAGSDDRIAHAARPAQFSVEWPELRSSEPPVLSMRVEPLRVDRAEAYIVIVSANFEGKMHEVGAFSFFPPPRLHETRKFVLPLSGEIIRTGAASGRLELVAQLRTAEDGRSLRTSAVKILDAKIEAGDAKN